MNEPTKGQMEEFWKGYGKHTYWTYEKGYNNYPPIDLNNLFKWTPSIIVGIYFRYYPGGCECELTYMTEAGFDTVKSWVKNETGDENRSRELSALALFWALYPVLVKGEG